MDRSRSSLSGGKVLGRVYEDEHVPAFMGIQPVTNGHLLVVPRAHMAPLCVKTRLAGRS
jgi:hypothetical protein